jgi:hypothetical protein
LNLHGIVSGVIGAVNPQIIASIQCSTGYTTNGDGSRTPSYAEPVDVKCQIQALQYNDLVQTDGLNIQGARRKIYMSGHWAGLVRVDQKGGDLITMPNGDIYLVVLVLEHWPDWTSVAVTLQNGS